MSKCDHVFRFYTNKEVLMVCLNCGLELNADDISLRMETLKNAAEYMANELAARDALIERLVEAGTMVLAHSLPMNETGAKWRMAWQPLVAKYRAMKKESVE